MARLVDDSNSIQLPQFHPSLPRWPGWLRTQTVVWKMPHKQIFALACLHSCWPCRTADKWEKKRRTSQRSALTLTAWNNYSFKNGNSLLSLWSGKRHTFIWAVALQKPTSVLRPWISSRQQAAHWVSSESENPLLTKQPFTSVHLHHTRLALDADSAVILLSIEWFQSAVAASGYSE